MRQPEDDAMASTQAREPLVYQPLTLPPRGNLDQRAPLNWLHARWPYFQPNRGVSIGYGLVFAAIGILIIRLGLDRPHSILTFWTGLPLVGPLLAMGLSTASHNWLTEASIRI
jgi:hypothetical protein